MTSLIPPPAAEWGRASASAVSPAERRVLDELGRGLPNRAIAAALVLSPRTVESHISSLLAKTGCRNRTQLLLWALAMGISAQGACEGEAPAAEAAAEKAIMTPAGPSAPA